MIAAWEWGGLCGWPNGVIRISYAVSFGLSLWLIYEIIITPYSTNYMLVILISAGVWWLITVHWVGAYQYRNSNKIPTSSVLKMLAGFFVLLPAGSALLFLRAYYINGSSLVLFLLILIWVADSSAYFVGRRWGRTKLANKISPGKTWEGVSGALLACLLVALLYTELFVTFTAMERVGFVLLCVLTVIASVLGDLVESLFKRQAGVKDSSQLLPGHGGVLDRIDSLTAAVPIFVLGFLLLEAATELGHVH